MTFEEWFRETHREYADPTLCNCREAWDGGVASQQVEIDRLQQNSIPNWIANRAVEENGALNVLVDDLKAEITKLQRDWNEDALRKLQQLARYEAVVEAARLFLMNLWDADVDAFPDMEQLRAALAALDQST